MFDRTLDRRDFLTLTGFGGLVVASGLPGRVAQAGGPAQAAAADFSFVQLSDTHWGFSGPPNPDAANTLREAVAAVNALARQPDFVVFTGDLTHTTDDDALRRKRLAEFKAIVADLKVQQRYFMPGEHDAALDAGKAYQESFGATRYTFDHKGVHFVALDNVSDPGGQLGDPQLDWLHRDLAKVPASAPVVVLTHRPLFELAPQWDWWTKDGGRALEILQRHDPVTVFYGHIHQEHHRVTGRIAHHASRSLVFPLPAPLSPPKKAPLPWDPDAADHGLGFREIDRSMRDKTIVVPK